jgi:hypothetical protein
MPAGVVVVVLAILVGVLSIPFAKSAVVTRRFSTRMAWDGSGKGYRDVVLTELVNGRPVLLATIPLNEWISLGATQYVLELQIDGKRAPPSAPCPTAGQSGKKRNLLSTTYSEGVDRFFQLSRCFAAVSLAAVPVASVHHHDLGEHKDAKIHAEAALRTWRVLTQL